MIPKQPTIVCLCGSTRFADEFHTANHKETLAGKIVLTTGYDATSDIDMYPLGERNVEAALARDELHRRKIDLADEVLILNIDGYIGKRTLSQIIYADRLKKLLRWQEVMKCPCCNGRGGHDSEEDSHTCALCHGTGTVGK